MAIQCDKCRKQKNCKHKDEYDAFLKIIDDATTAAKLDKHVFRGQYIGLCLIRDEKVK